jgi:plasmid stability protein
MIVELPENLESALKAQANARGVSVAGYVVEILERNLAASVDAPPLKAPFKTGRGILARHGQAPSAEEIDSSRAEMFRSFGGGF